MLEYDPIEAMEDAARKLLEVLPEAKKAPKTAESLTAIAGAAKPLLDAFERLYGKRLADVCLWASEIANLDELEEDNYEAPNGDIIKRYILRRENGRTLVYYPNNGRRVWIYPGDIEVSAGTF